MKAAQDKYKYIWPPAEPIFVSFFIIFVRCMAALKHHGFMTGLLEIKQRGNVN